MPPYAIPWDITRVIGYETVCPISFCIDHHHKNVCLIIFLLKEFAARVTSPPCYAADVVIRIWILVGEFIKVCLVFLYAQIKMHALMLSFYALQPPPPSSPNVAFDRRRSNFEVCSAIPDYPQSNHYEVYIRNAESGMNAWHKVPAYITSARAPCDPHTKCDAGSKNRPGDANNLYGWTHSYAKFEKLDESVEIKVVTRSLPRSVTARPDMTDTTVDRITEAEVFLTLRRHGHVFLDFDGGFSDEFWPLKDANSTWTGQSGHSYAQSHPPKHALTLHALPYEHFDIHSSNSIFFKHPSDPAPNATNINGKRIVYFTKGIHEHSCDPILVRSDTLYYVACDAVILGNFYGESANNVTITGKGIVSGENKRHPSDDEMPPAGCRKALDDYCYTPVCIAHKNLYYVPVTLTGTNNTISSLTFVDTAYHGLMLRDVTYSSTVSSVINYVSFISWRLNGDGANPFNNVRIERCFFRTQDDGVYVGGKGVYESVFWTDYNGAVFLLSRIGAMKSGTGAGPITVFVDRCWVLFHRAASTDWTGGGVIALRGEGQSGTQEYPVAIRNLIVYDRYMTLPGISIYTLKPIAGVDDDMCNGTYPIRCFNGDSTYKRNGNITSLTLSDIDFVSTSAERTSAHGVPDAVFGFDKGFITVRFQNVRLNGQVFHGEDERRRLTSGSSLETNPLGDFATVDSHTGIPPAPPAPAPPPPPPPPHGLARQDPHLVGAHGDTMDFRGRHNALYAILSVPRLTFALRTQNATFIKPGYTPRLVHGSFFTDAFWKVRTAKGTILVVNTSASNVGFAVVNERGLLLESSPRIWSGYTRDDMQLLYKQATLVMRVAGWETNVTRKPVYNRLSGPSWRFDLSIRPLNDTGLDARHGKASGIVAPHGLIGQTWDDDDMAVDGAQDDYDHSGTEVWTTSMAEGGIEGAAHDYELQNEFSHEFAFARFDNNAYTAPRNASQLKGIRRASRMHAAALAVDQDVRQPRI